MKNNIIMMIGIIAMIGMPMTVRGADMCIKSDATMVVLDPQIGGTALSNNNTGKTWSTKFSYGVVSGIGACGTENIAQGAIATNQNNLDPYTDRGNYCFCKMLRPVPSLWVYSGSVSNCPNSCASSCSSNVASAVALRGGLFGSANGI